MKSRWSYYVGLIVLFLVGALPLHASVTVQPTFQWKGEFGDGGAVRSVQVATDSGGNFYQAGRTDTGAQPAWVVRYSEVGVQEWLVNVPGALPRTVSDLRVDAQGNSYVSGYQGSTTASDYFVFKLSKAGQVLWQTVVAGYTVDTVMDMAIAPGGDVFVLGSSLLSGTELSILMRLHGGTGALLWGRKSPISTVGQPRALVALSNGDAAAAGHLNGNIFVQRYLGSSGAIVWNTTVDNGLEEKVLDLAVDPADGALVAAGFTDPGTNRDWFTARLSSAGTVQWKRRLNGQGNMDDWVFYATVGVGGRIYVSGQQIHSPGGVGAWWTPSVASYTSAGTLVYNSQVPNTNPDNIQLLKGFTVDTGGHAYLAVQDEPTATTHAIRAAAFNPKGGLAWQFAYDENAVATHLRSVGIAVSVNDVVYLGGIALGAPNSGDSNVITLVYR